MEPTQHQTEAIKELLDIRAQFGASLLLFTQAFFKLRTGREFLLSNPRHRESHYFTIARALMRVFEGKNKKLLINIPPRYGKTELVIHFIAWAMGRFPDSNFLYVSYSHSLAAKQTRTIRDIMTLPYFKKIFDVIISEISSARDDFETTKKGTVFGAGAGGTITGRGAGIMGVDRFGGCIVIDDIHKPEEVTSDVVRQNVIDWYYNTLQSRMNSKDTPIIFIGQRLHENDLAANLMASGEWETVIIPALDEQDQPLHPLLHNRDTLLKMRRVEPYVFAAQYQQNPQPSGGGIFKADWFTVVEKEPDIIFTFITADTAETSETYNDATVFSLWGVYKIKYQDVETDMYALHWMDCVELRVEPKDLQPKFMEFLGNCMRQKKKPQLVAIEKKSTGTTLLSVLEGIQGLELLPIERTKASGNKATRFLAIQSFISTHRVTLPLYANHTKMCIEHCAKITANDSHRFDDIADTLADAVKLALIDKVLIARYLRSSETSNVVVMDNLISKFRRLDRLKSERRW
jgi:predicted phage terminase large subunit-like protein